MKFYPTKLRDIRKRQKLTIMELADLMGNNRRTIGMWEMGKIIPSEKKLRKLSEILNVPVNEISDLKPALPKSDIKLSSISNAWLEMKQNDCSQYNFDLLVKGIAQIQSNHKETKFIMDALLNAFPSLFYLKDANNKYISANSKFIDNISKSKKYSILGFTDFDILPKNEAEKNSKEDEFLISEGRNIYDKEEFIPGTKKQKWGITTKKLILDKSGKVCGLLGCFTDITKTKNAEEIRRLLELHLDEMEISISILRKGKPPYHNNAFEKIFGYSFKDKDFKQTHDLFVKHCLHPDEIKKEIQSRKLDYWPEKQILKIIKHDGTAGLLESYASNTIIAGQKCTFLMEREIDKGN
jgi:transcriptional regulator with XRE-family HTH domain